MIKKIAYLCMVALIFPLYVYAQTFNKNAFLKDYSEDLIITTQVRGERNKAILRGTEAKKIGNLFYKIILEFNLQFTLLGITAFGLQKSLLQ